MTHTRRSFLGGLASAAAVSLRPRPAGAQAPTAAAPVTPAATRPDRRRGSRERGIKLGLAPFAIRAFGWKAPHDRLRARNARRIFLSELNVLESRDDTYLKGLRAQATRAAWRCTSGWPVCAHLRHLRPKGGTAVEQLKDGIRMARTVGSPVIRCFLGRQEDPGTHGGIDTHIKNTVDVCKAVRAEALAAGVKIAIENHAGDMQAWELAGLVEAAGPDYVGVNIDPGNATWTLEDPVASLETLAPYVACTSIRDSAVWETETGVVVEWVAMGDGNVDFKRWADVFAEKVKRAGVLETFAGLRPLNYLSDPAFSNPCRDAGQDLPASGHGQARQAA